MTGYKKDLNFRPSVLTCVYGNGPMGAAPGQRPMSLINQNQPLTNTGNSNSTNGQKPMYVPNNKVVPMQNVYINNNTKFDPAVNNKFPPSKGPHGQPPSHRHPSNSDYNNYSNHQSSFARNSPNLHGSSGPSHSSYGGSANNTFGPNTGYTPSQNNQNGGSYPSHPNSGSGHGHLGGHGGPGPENTSAGGYGMNRGSNMRPNAFKPYQHGPTQHNGHEGEETESSYHQEMPRERYPSGPNENSSYRFQQSNGGHSNVNGGAAGSGYGPGHNGYSRRELNAGPGPKPSSGFQNSYQARNSYRESSQNVYGSSNRQGQGVFGGGLDRRVNDYGPGIQGRSSAVNSPTISPNLGMSTSIFENKSNEKNIEALKDIWSENKSAEQAAELWNS